MLNAEKFKDEFFTDENRLDFIKAEKAYCRETGKCALKTWIDLVDWLLSEYKEPILDDAERRYLSSVCRPYEVLAITKSISNSRCFEWIEIISLRDDNHNVDSTNLPFFKSKTMYKGMELEKRYKPQELGVCCKNNPKGEIKHG